MGIVIASLLLNIMFRMGSYYWTGVIVQVVFMLAAFWIQWRMEFGTWRFWK